MERDPPTPLIATKMIPPARPEGLIQRGRLLEVIPQVQASRLCVIKAPAGFGKTTLAMDWAERLREAGHRIGWLSLDPDDDESMRFLYYLVGTIEQACSGSCNIALSLIKARALLPPATLVSALLNELLDINEELTVFIDDYHCLREEAIHDALALLLLHAPDNVRFVIATRSEPPLPLARMRANNQLLEIDASGLRFDEREARRFFEQSTTASLGPVEIHRLLGATEGWVAGLRIAALSLRGQTDPRTCVRTFSGRHRAVSAYMSDVMDRLPDKLLMFMLQTSILGRLTPTLCDAVTGARDSHGLLEAIERQQLFIEPLDSTGTWFRYHQLFAEYLHRRLKRELGDQISNLHRRASRWYAERSQWVEAVRHALAAGDVDQAVEWIEHCAMGLVKEGDILTLLGWQRMLPRDVLRERLLVGRVRLYIAEGRLMEGGACVTRLRQLVREHPAPEPCAWRSIHHCAALGQAYLALAHQHGSEAVSVLQPLCEETRASGNDLLFIRAGTLLAIASLSVGRIDQAIDVFRDVIAAARPSRFCRTILDQGPEVGALLRQLKALEVRRPCSEATVTYIDDLLKACNQIHPSQSVALKDAPPLLEPLGPRELEIVSLLAKGQSNKEISRSLGIAPETVKWYLKNIYLKLAVQRRAQAVVRAQSLGLIDLAQDTVM